MQVIEALARLHAHFWQDARFESELAWVPRAMRGALGAKLIEQAREKFSGDFPPVFAELCRLYAEHHERVCDLWDEGESTLIHGDIHAGNQFLDAGQVGFYDWAVISRSPGIRDVGIYLCNSCPTDLRRAEQDELAARLPRRADRRRRRLRPRSRRLWRRYRRAVLYGWVAATTTAAMGDRWQPHRGGNVGDAPRDAGVRRSRDRRGLPRGPVGMGHRTPLELIQLYWDRVYNASTSS